MWITFRAKTVGWFQACLAGTAAVAPFFKVGVNRSTMKRVCLRGRCFFAEPSHASLDSSFLFYLSSKLRVNDLTVCTPDCAIKSLTIDGFRSGENVVLYCIFKNLVRSLEPCIRVCQSYVGCLKHPMCVCTSTCMQGPLSDCATHAWVLFVCPAVSAGGQVIGLRQATCSISRRVETRLDY